MPLTDAIQALSPWFYWPLNDAVGSTTIADASGNSRNGTLTGTAQFGVYGPESTTTSARFFSDGQLQGNIPFFGSWSNLSIMFMWTTPADGTIPALSDVMGIGDIANKHAHGLWLGQLSTSVGAANMRITNTSGLVADAVMPFPQERWHLVTYTLTTPSAWTFQIDALTQSSTSHATGTAPIVGDKFWIQSTNRIVLAHVALFTRALTQTEINTVGTQVTVWPFQNPINVQAGGSTTVDLTPVLTDTEHILLNQSTALPQITDIQNTVHPTQTTVNTIHDQLNGLISVTFPDLATVLDGITSAVTSTVESGAGLISRTIGQMLSGREGDTLTEFDFGTTCDFTQATYELGGGLFFRMVFTVTSMPDWYVFTGPADTYVIQSLGTIEFHRSGRLERRIGLHTTTLDVTPLPGIADVPVIGEFSVTPGDYQVVVTPASGVCINTKGFHQP